MEPLRYSCGVEIRKGDLVDFDGDPAVVEDVIATHEDQKAWGLDERGVMFKSKGLGLVFEPETSVCWPETVFLKRGDLTTGCS